MGVDASLLPATVDEAHTLSDLIERRQIAASDEGREMTAALLDMMRTNLPDGFKRCPDAMLRFFLPAPVADGLGVPSHPLDPMVDDIMGLAGHVAQTLLPEQRRTLAFRAFSARVVQWMFNVELDGRPATFTLPEHLSQAWKTAPADSEEGFWDKLRAWWHSHHL